MHDVTVFGGCLRSELPFPELRPAASPPDWTLRVAGDLPSLHGATPIGEDVVDGDIRVRAYRAGDDFVLEYDDTGTFVIATRGRAITWHTRPNASDAAARLDVLGRVLPMALHASGMLTLHGSAVCIAGRAIAFLAPKYHGKSTLAYALVSAGARIVTDDALAVDPGPPPMARPGVHIVRLYSDSASRLGAGRGHATPGGGKLSLDALPDEARTRVSAPLDAIYLLTPVEPRPGRPAARRAAVDSITAALALVRHAKLGPLLGRGEAPVLFERAVDLARVVPVYSLSVARDLGRLEDVVTEVMAWHGARTAG
jgi:hypothetical protein